MTAASIWFPGSSVQCCALPPTADSKQLVAGSGIQLSVVGDTITISSTVSDYTLSGITATFLFSAADGQTVFTLPATTQIAAGVDVFRNGVKLLQGLDYYTLGLDVILYQSCAFGTSVEVQAKTNVVIGDTNLQEVIGYANAAAASAAASAQSALDSTAAATAVLATHILEADPHTQYVLDTDLTALIAAYYTSAQVDTLLTGYSLTSHNHTGVYQPVAANLTDIAALAVTDGNIIVGNGTNWIAESGATARASLGLGSGNSVTFTSLKLSGNLETTQIKTSTAGTVLFYPGYNNLDWVATAYPTGTGIKSELILKNANTGNDGVLRLKQDTTASYLLAGKIGSGTALPLILGANDTQRLALAVNGNVTVGTAALATNATAGFFWIPSCPGTPTGAPTAPYSNAAALVADTTNNRLSWLSGAAWKQAPHVVGPTAWTPTIAFGGASVGITYSTQEGDYTSIDGIVYAPFRIVLSNKGSSTGTFTISLPVACKAGFNGGVINISLVVNCATLAGGMHGRIQAGTSTGYITQTNAAGSVNMTDANVTNTSEFRGVAIYRA